MLLHLKQNRNNMSKIDKKALEESIITALKTVTDPEIPVNIYDLGLIYEINIDDDANVSLVMTLTNPNCPVADKLPADVKKAAESATGVNSVNVTLVFEPVWSKDMISDAAMLELGLL